MQNASQEWVVLDKLSVQQRDLVARFLFLLVRLTLRPFLDPKVVTALESNPSEFLYKDYFPEAQPQLKTSAMAPRVNPTHVSLLLKALFALSVAFLEEVRYLFIDLNI